MLNASDHVYFVHPSTNISFDISTNTCPMYQLTYLPSVDRYVSQHVGRVLVDMSTEMCHLTYRPRYRSNISRYVDQHSTDMSAKIGCPIVG